MTAIKTRPVHGYSKFLSTGSARGSRVVTNKEMCTLFDPLWGGVDERAHLLVGDYSRSAS